MAIAKRRGRSSKRIVPRVKVWIEIDGSYVFGRGMSKILRAVAEKKSIKHAAKSLGKSYRYIWNRIKEAEEALGASLVETQVGGKDLHRSSLTDLGDTLISEFDRWRSRMADLLDKEFPKSLKSLLEKG